MGFNILAIIYVHYMARSFCEPIKLPKVMPKMAKCLKCLKPFGQEALDRLRYSIDFIKRKKQSMQLLPLVDFLFSMLKISDLYNKDGAKRHHNFSAF
jgi:hypothetical protein